MADTDDDHEKWGFWICPHPDCGDISQDPEGTVSTVCHNGHHVLLNYIGEGEEWDVTLNPDSHPA